MTSPIVTDRTFLSVRVDSTGHREWLDATGTTALVWWERSGPYWVARIGGVGEDGQGVRCESELDAIEWLINNVNR